MSDAGRTPACNVLRGFGHGRWRRSAESSGSPYRVSRPTLRNCMALRLRRRAISASWAIFRRRRRQQQRQDRNQLTVTFDVDATRDDKSEESAAAAVPSISCSMCSSEAAETRGPLLRPCASCETRYCIECIVSHFDRAAQPGDGYPLLPKCECGAIIPLHAAKPHLTSELQDRYRARFDLWSASFHLYCPVPTCSAFIHDRNLPDRVLGKDSSRLNERATITCPNGHNFCSTCKATHDPQGPCQVSALDTQLQAVIGEWGYKKCPKCGQGVKRMYGCSHMMCTCGAHWCWHCLREIGTCDALATCEDLELDDDYGGVTWDDADTDNATDQQQQQPDDSEGRDRQDAGVETEVDGRDAAEGPYMLCLNDEPEDPLSGHFGGCPHSFVVYNPAWKLGTVGTDWSADAQKQEQLIEPVDMECHRCWKPVFNVRYFQDRRQDPNHDGFKSHTIADKANAERFVPTPASEGLGWVCRQRQCGLLVCFDCQALLTARAAAAAAARLENIRQGRAAG